MKTEFDEKDMAIIGHVMKQNIKESVTNAIDFFEEMTDKIEGEDNKKYCFSRLILSYSSSMLGSIVSRFLTFGEVVGISEKKFVEEFLNHILNSVSEAFTEERFKELNDVKLKLKSHIN